jgi:hypothetical protein
MSDFEFKGMETSTGGGLDGLFEREPEIISPVGGTKPKVAARVKVASLGDLDGFERQSAETLVHKSTRDLWTLKQGDGGYYIERLFEDSGDPLKG